MISWFKKNKRIYLDHASITPICSEAREAMEEGYRLFYNPSSIHADGVAAKKVLERSRRMVADFLHAHPDEVIFTGSGTESCNMALLGAVAEAKKHISRPHIIVSAIEHPSVLETARKLSLDGVEMSILPVDQNGLVHIQALKDLVKENTVLISILMTNNEIGTIEPIRDISLFIQKYRKEHKSSYPLFHTDASQALLYEDVDMRRIHADLLTGDSIKCYGPRGIGMLFKRRGVVLEPLVHGGGQEWGLRSGTENLPGIAGFAEALTIAERVRDTERERLVNLREYAWKKIIELVSTAERHGKEDTCSPHILNVCFRGSEAEFVVLSLDALGISCSYASACKSLHGDASSEVVRALGKEDCQSSSVRFSFGRRTREKDIDALIRALQELVHRSVIKNT